MICCEQEILTFANKDTVTIAYTSSMRALYGDRPTVNVYYQNGNDFEAATFTRVELKGSPVNQIVVYNGGPATGFIKIS